METTFWLNHRFEIHSFFDRWYDVGGVYIFAGPNYQTGRWEPLYVGQTNSFRSRLIPGYEKWIQAMLMGATRVHATIVPLYYARLGLEALLIRELRPPLNIQLPTLADFFQPPAPPPSW